MLSQACPCAHSSPCSNTTLQQTSTKSAAVSFKFLLVIVCQDLHSTHACRHTLVDPQTFPATSLTVTCSLDFLFLHHYAHIHITPEVLAVRFPIYQSCCRAGGLTHCQVLSEYNIPLTCLNPPLSINYSSLFPPTDSYKGSTFLLARSRPGPPQPHPVNLPQPTCTLCIDVSRGGGLSDADGACNTLTTDLAQASTYGKYYADAPFVCILPTTQNTVTACSVFQNLSGADDFLNSWSSDMMSQVQMFSDFNINGYGMCQNPPYMYQDGATGSYQCGSQSSMETVVGGLAIGGL